MSVTRVALQPARARRAGRAILFVTGFWAAWVVLRQISPVELVEGGMVSEASDEPVSEDTDASARGIGGGTAAFFDQRIPEQAPIPEDDLGSQIRVLAGEHAGALAVLVAVVCAFVAKEEPAKAPPAPPTPIEKRPDYGRVCAVAALLCGLSGMVNAIAIIEMGGTVAHQTGNTSHFGRLLGIDGLRFGLLIVAFSLGAGVAGFRKADGDALFEGRYCPCLMSAAVGTAAGVFIQFASGQGTWVTLPLWCFAQGLQNGVTSRFSSMPLRTTHHTGSLTDAGVGIGAFLRARARGEPLPPMKKPALLMLCMATYVGGGCLAKAATDTWSIFAALPPAAAMAVLSVGCIPVAAVPPLLLEEKKV